MKNMLFKILTAIIFVMSVCYVSIAKENKIETEPSVITIELKNASNCFGISVKDIDNKEAKELNVKNGVIVIGVEQSSSADKAGVEIGDVISVVNGSKVLNAREFNNIISRISNDVKTVKFDILRNKEKKTIIISNEKNTKNLAVGGQNIIVQRAIMRDGKHSINIVESKPFVFSMNGSIEVNDNGSYDKIKELEFKSMKLAVKYADKDEKKKDDVKKELQDTLGELFDLKQKSRSEEIEKLEKRMSELKKSVQDREKNKSEIIKNRFLELTGEKSNLDW